MKIDIWDGPEKTEKVLRLRLINNGHAIDLMAVDADGARIAYIMSITERGIKMDVAAADLGLATDEAGRVKIIP